MLTDVVRKSLERVQNRFVLVLVTADRTRQLMNGARPVVENPNRERLSKVAMREISTGKVEFDGEIWKVDRPPMSELLAATSGREPDAEDEDLLFLRSGEEEE